ncbi:MAG TPA: DUF1801 domain-containing protein [Actinomycetaceae bacterium]|nr:DUF1801 domain-containing protein [Actinomycetaceae bacterium]
MADTAARDAAAHIDALIESLDDWRGETLARVRALIHEAVPGVTEGWKWRGSPTWESGGILVIGNAHKAKVKLTFPKGAHLDDPDGLFNAGLEGNAWRSIDLFEGDSVDREGFVRLMRVAAAHNARD